MRAWFANVALLVAAACGTPTIDAPDPYIPNHEIRSGYAFLTPETQALQDDPFENPGLLWVDRGETLFSSADTDAPSCASCHSNGLQGVAATYPKVDPRTGEVLNLEARINSCRTEHQKLDPLGYESDALLALTTYIASESRGEPISVDLSGVAGDAYARGRDYFLTRRGQFNLSCQQCHTENWGQQLRGDTISQGHGNGFPAYRLEWQSVGSLHRRLRDCDTGVRAEPLPYGDPTYIAVELFLAARAQGLDAESPAVRR
ncbi:MAG: sulfur oxidation c-type cytochrome SoxA [Pseudomonadota bacterium]